MFLLAKYQEDLFRDKFIVSDVDDDDLDTINLWWQTAEKRARWVSRFKSAVDGLPDRILEKREAQLVFDNCDLRFSRINEMVEGILGLPTEKFIERFVQPVLSLFDKKATRAKKIEEVAQAMREFSRKWETNVVDQVIAISEAINESGVTRTDEIRMRVAQWGFEEFMRNFLLLELKVKYGEIDLPTTVDDLETEQMELTQALSIEPWGMERAEKFKKEFVVIRKAMDSLKFETEVKRGFKRAFDHAVGVREQTLSAIELLKNIEEVWQGFVDDDTLEEFWEWEQEEADS